MRSVWIPRSEGFETHFLEWQPKDTNGRLPIICIHGNLTNARMFNWIGDLFSSDDMDKPRRVIAVDIRGRGDSGMPEKGFTLSHMASDIEAVMNHLCLSEAHFMAYSRGTAYALQFALLHPDSVQGLVVGDHPASNRKFSEEWANRMNESYPLYRSWDALYEALSAAENINQDIFEARKEQYYAERAGTIQKRYAKSFPTRLQRESEDDDLSSALGRIRSEMLLLKGNEPGSLLDEEQMLVYERFGAAVVRVEGAGHDVFEPRTQLQEALISYYNRLG